jgi:hypothetical protein
MEVGRQPVIVCPLATALRIELVKTIAAQYQWAAD